MEAASPDLEKQGFLAVVILNREYSGQQEQCFQKNYMLLLQKISKLESITKPKN